MLLQVAVIVAPAVYLYMRLKSTQTPTAAWLELWLHTHISPSGIQLARPTPEGQKLHVLPLSMQGCRSWSVSQLPPLKPTPAQDSSLGVWYICFYKTCTYIMIQDR